MESDNSSPLLVYHQATLDLLGKEYASKPSHPVESFAHFHELNLPASVQEWFSLPFAVDVLSRYSNSDEVLEPAAFVIHTYENLAILEFLIENQACWACGILLDGSEDPPVVINADPAASRPVWNYCAERFSIFVYTRVFDFQYLVEAWQEDQQGEEEWFVDGPPPVGGLRNWLDQCFEAEPVTCDASYNVNRFSRHEKQQRIVIYEKQGAAQWVLTAATAEERQRLVTGVTAML